MKLAFFDTKPYDIPGFDRYALPAGIEIKYYEPNLNRDTVSLANGFDAVCVFVNDTVDAVVVDRLYEMGVKAIVLRCAGFNNVDLEKAKELGSDYIVVGRPITQAQDPVAAYRRYVREFVG